jgi:hypothetical protein
VHKNIGGLGLTNPKGFQPQILKLARRKPSQHKNWSPSINWAMVEGHVSSSSSKIWGQIMRVWKRFVDKL